MNALSNKQVATTKPKQIVICGSLQVLDAKLNEKIESNGFQNFHFIILHLYIFDWWGHECATCTCRG